ncbi:hypothetical protein Tco_1288246 [Tanacetum coccineum]
MGDENPIHTLGYFSKPSHEGYRNTIELPEGNNVVPLRSDTIRLVQNGCSFHELRSIDYAVGGRLRKLRPDKAWAVIERLAQYENEGWNDAFVSEDVSLNYENPDIEQLLGIMKHKVDTLMKDAISLMGKNESVFRLATNEMYRQPSEPSCQEEFEHNVTLTTRTFEFNIYFTFNT